MLNYQSAKQLKKLARLIENAGSEKGRALNLGEALDALAKGHGVKSWSAMAPRLSAKGVDAELLDIERLHIRDAGDEDYGVECTMQVHTGFFIKTPAYPVECDYVRICDPLGREIAYWQADEWGNDPAIVMGAIIGALNRKTEWVPPSVSALPCLTDSANGLKLPFGIVVRQTAGGTQLVSDLVKQFEDSDEPADEKPQLITDTLESFLLALAGEGVALQDPRIIRAIEATVESLANNAF